MTIQIKAIEQFVHVVLFIMSFKVVLTFMSVDETLVFPVLLFHLAVTVTVITTETHAAVWIQETPSTILNKRFRILVNRFHDLGPVQALYAFRVFNVTRTEEYRKRKKK